MDKVKDKGAIIVCAVAIVLIIVLLVVKGGQKNNDENTNQNTNKQIENSVTEPTQDNTTVEKYVQESANGGKVNTSEQLKKTKTIDGLEISDIRLVENGNLSQIVANVKNPTSETKGNFDILITALDENGNKLLSLTGVIDTVKPGETVQLNASVTADIANAYDFTVEKK